MYGRCKSFVDDHGTSDVDDGISDATFRTLQLVLAYNTSDWTYGWSYYMDGFSIFYSPKGEVVLDHMVIFFFESDLKLNQASVTVNSRINSVLLLAQHRTIMLGFPYSECIKDGKLTWFSTYTKKNCKFECLIKEPVDINYRF